MAVFHQDTEHEYFTSALMFFNEVQWLHNVPVTQILREDTFNKFPENWLNALLLLENEELNDFVVNKIIKPQWPETLKCFVESCKRFNKMPTISLRMLSLKLPNNFRKGLNIKKQHEILYLTELVHKQCTLHGLQTIVDFGAGLGYVCQLLHYLYGYYVLGLEGDEDKVKNAQQRQKAIYQESLNYVKYVHWKVNEDSIDAIESIVKENFKTSNKICMIGLHACGDLSVYASKIFVKMKAASVLILISCCYHKLSVSTKSETKQYFSHFPMAQSLQNAIKATKLDVGQFLRQPFLRLACQEPAERWCCKSEQSHNEHSFYVLARAVLELYAYQNKFTLVKRVRKATRKSRCTSFRTYIRDSLLRYTLEKIKRPPVPNDTFIDMELVEEQMLELWEKHNDKLRTVEVYTGLQLMLQSPAESLILRDRLCWFWEQNLEAEIIPVTDKTLSPRSYAIVSCKKS